MKPRAATTLAIGSVLAAALIGGSLGPQRPSTAFWYTRLRKPPATPPGPVIGAVWGVLEILLCLTGYRLLTRDSTPARSAALSCWAANLAGLAGFPAVFFGGKRLDAGAAVATALLASACGTTATAARVDAPAALASLPLVFWTGFATFLSEELWRRN